MIIKICAAALTAGILGMILKELGFSGAKLVSVCSLCAVMLFAVSRLGDVNTELVSIEKMGGVSGVCEDMMKIVGVGYLFGICADICMELGESMLSKGLLTVGKIEIIILTIPTIKRILNMALEMIK